MDHQPSAPATTPAKAQPVLVLQGGGALGSYQAGAYQALCHFDFEPEWIAGISIGAINAAIIAGNRARETRRSPEGILGDGVVPGVLESGDIGRPRAIAVQRDQRRLDRDLWRARLLHAARSAGAVLAAGQPAIAELLRHRAAEEDAGAAGRFRPHQRLQDAAFRRRGQRHLGQSQIFRQFRIQETRQEDRPRAHHGLRRAAAGLSRRRSSMASIIGTAASPPIRRSIMCWARRPTAMS